MIQTLDFHSIHLRTEHDEDRPYVIAGPYMYAIGMMSGAPPRIGDEHLVGEMGGLWVHPIKALDSWGLRIENIENAELRKNGDPSISQFSILNSEFVGHFWGVERVRSFDGLIARELEWIDEDEPVLFVRVTIINESGSPRQAHIVYRAEPNLRPCWMSPMWSGKDLIQRVQNGITAFDSARPEWAAAVVMDGDLERDVTLGAGESLTLRVAVTATHNGGEYQARNRARQMLHEMDQRLAHKREVYIAAARFEGSNANLTGLQDLSGLDKAYRCALLNLKLLEARNMAGHYAIAGLPEFPNLFGCDTAYSAPGLCLAGRSDIAIDALRALKAVMMRQCGRTPHEIIPDGNIFHPGNTQETPQFVIAVSRVGQLVANGDKGDLLREMYPACRAAMLNYLRGGFTWAASRFPDYPHGNAMVEREGMLPLKLDAGCYAWKALKCLAEMGRALRDADTSGYHQYDRDIAAAEGWANRIEASFERDWWMESEGFYADSLGWDGRQQLDKHWTQVVPLEVGLASPEHATRVLDAIERDWLNEHGLPHTKGVEERVWTLPTVILALVAARAGRRELSLRLLKNIATTLQHGQLGLFEELIPHGLCFVQLWSAAMFVEIYEAMMHSA